MGKFNQQVRSLGVRGNAKIQHLGGELFWELSSKSPIAEVTQTCVLNQAKSTTSCLWSGASIACTEGDARIHGPER